jgi:UDP-3-O-[3-hydroxymyristoyl] glucosamine N-acyltransferase
MNVNFDVKALSKMVEGEDSFNHSFFVQDIKSLEAATEKDVAFVFDPEDNSVFSSLSLEKIKNSKAGVIVASKKWVKGKSFILVNDPLSALCKVVSFKEQKNNSDLTSLIHSTSVVEPSANIGKNTKIGAHVFIGSNCKIGENVTIYSGVIILDGSIIGDNSIIHAGVVIGSDGFGYRAMKTGLLKVPQIGIVRIGKYVEIGANACIDRAAFDETVICDGVKIDNLVHISHNVQIGQSTAILAQTAIAGGVKIGIGCQIGGQVAIRDHVTIGNGVKIVSKSAIMQNIKDGEIVGGIPAIPFSKWKRLIVAWYKLPELMKRASLLEKKLEEKQSLFSNLKSFFLFFKKK